ncbi:response regulator [bacterium]|nr:response regulator [bacterium]
MPRSQRPIKMLVVEDNPGDAVLFQAFFSQTERRTEFLHVSDGEEALQFLRRENKYPNAPRPDLIVVDINLPRIDGKEVVREVKKDPDLHSIPVIVLTSSENEEDIRCCYEYGANCVLIKAADVEGAAQVFELLEHFWVNTVRLMPDPTASPPLMRLA